MNIDNGCSKKMKYKNIIDVQKGDDLILLLNNKGVVYIETNANFDDIFNVNIDTNQLVNINIGIDDNIDFDEKQYYFSGGNGFFVLAYDNKLYHWKQSIWSMRLSVGP